MQITNHQQSNSNKDMILLDWHCLLSESCYSKLYYKDQNSFVLWEQQVLPLQSKVIEMAPIF